MMTYEQIKELIQLVSEHRLHSLEIERAGFRIKISGNSAGHIAESLPGQAIGAPPQSEAPAAASAVAPSVAGTVRGAAHPGLHVVTSPIVGTFYSSPSPEADSFVHVGDRVRKGQVLCIVEAMKLMNEIECDADGVVVEIYPKNAQPVEFGEPLFGVRAD